MSISYAPGSQSAAAHALALIALLARLGAALLVFMLVSILFLIAIAFTAYRLPAFQERQVIEGRVLWNKVEGGNRSIFEQLFAGRTIVRLDGETEIYLRESEENEWLFSNNGRYRATVSASPLLFGGFGDARLIKVERYVPPPRPAPAD